MRHKHIRIITYLGVAAIMLVGVVAGCTTAPTSTEPPLVIGAPCAMGTIAKDLSRGALLAADEINATEGGVMVNGVLRPLKVVATDIRDLEAGIPIQDVVLAYKNLIGTLTREKVSS